MMTDLETASQRLNAAILSIGAVKFGGGKILDKFYRVVSIDSCVKYGLHVDPNTIKWWSEQPPAARAILRESMNSTLDLKQALTEFSDFIYTPSMEFWTFGIAFDVPILVNAFEAVGDRFFIDWWNYKDARTIFDLQPKEDQLQQRFDRKDTYHNALDDSIFQAENLMHILDI